MAAHDVFHNFTVSPAGATTDKAVHSGVAGAAGAGDFQVSYVSSAINGSLRIYDQCAALARLRAIGSGLK